MMSSTVLMLSLGASSYVLPHLRPGVRLPMRRLRPTLCAEAEDAMSPPDEAQSAALAEALPSPALQPREIITTLLHALHKTNFDRPHPRFGCEVVLRFLSPSNPASRASPQRFGEYLSQPWYNALLSWAQFKWEGDVVLLEDGAEAYQQVGVREAPNERWTSVRWIMKRVPSPADEASEQYMVEAVIVEEPDGDEQMSWSPSLGNVADEVGAAQASEPEAPGDVVLRVMRALRHVDEPTPLHGCEVAIRQCSPANAASRLSPEAFLQYLREPWYVILTEWDEIELEDEAEPLNDDGGLVSQDVLVRRQGDDSWTIVNWQLSRHNGLWLTDSLTITE
tara:strand:+ start:1024 stop:2031 length:1008 start_codon:yes stop_codon:yes gene_type:complete